MHSKCMLNDSIVLELSGIVGSISLARVAIVGPQGGRTSYESVN